MIPGQHQNATKELLLAVAQRRIRFPVSPLRLHGANVFLTAADACNRIYEDLVQDLCCSKFSANLLSSAKQLAKFNLDGKTLVRMLLNLRLGSDMQWAFSPHYSELRSRNHLRQCHLGEGDLRFTTSVKCCHPSSFTVGLNFSKETATMRNHALSYASLLSCRLESMAFLPLVVLISQFTLRGLLQGILRARYSSQRHLC